MSPLSDRSFRVRFNRRMREKGVPAKACSKCFTVKALSQFPSIGGGKLRPECKPCHAARQAGYKARNPEKIRAKDRQYMAQRRSDPEYREWKRQYDAQYSQTPERRAAMRLKNHRRRALLYGAETDGHTWDELVDYWVEIGVTGCADCMRPLDDGMEVDHIVPLVRGGADTLENKLPLCPDCHASKVDRDPYAFYADRYPSLAPWLTPFVGLIPRLSEEEVQALVDAYEAR